MTYEDDSFPFIGRHEDRIYFIDRRNAEIGSYTLGEQEEMAKAHKRLVVAHEAEDISGIGRTKYMQGSFRLLEDNYTGFSADDLRLLSETEKELGRFSNTTKLRLKIKSATLSLFRDAMGAQTKQIRQFKDSLPKAKAA